jgi:hypothetical protein
MPSYRDAAELIRALDEDRVAPGTFGHHEHVMTAWHYARTESALEGLAALSGRLLEIATRQGVPERYHETVTCAWFFLIRERMERLGPDATWEAFAAANSDVLTGTAIDAYYRRETLREDEFARRVFVLPDRGLEGA